MSILEIKQLIKDRDLTPSPLVGPSGSGKSMMKQITWDDQWMGYDDEETIAMKLGYANNRCLGGSMIWSIDFDSGSGSGNIPLIGVHNSPERATVIPIGGTTLAPTETFILSAEVTGQVDALHHEGQQNLPVGPGAASCEVRVNYPSSPEYVD